MQPLPRTHARPLLGALAATALAIAGCGSEASSGRSATQESTNTTSSTIATTAPSTAPSVAPADTTTAATAVMPEPTEAATTDVPATDAPAPRANEVAVDLADYSITMPSTLPAGLTRLVATNRGAVEHHVIMARAHDGLTAAGVLGVFATDSNQAQTLVDFYPGPAGVGPGATGIVDVFLPAGEYIALCVIPAADGMPHAAKGMFQLITVTGDAGPAVEAASQSTIDLTDYDFVMSDGFTGRGSVLVTNRARQGHELAIYRESDDGSVDDFMSMAMDPAKDEVAFAQRYTPVGGISPMGPDRTGVIELDLAPGRYVFVCYLPDPSDGLPHAMHGMVREVVVE